MWNLLLFVFGYFTYLMWNVSLENYTPYPEYKHITVETQSFCPSLPDNYFVVETEEKVICDAGTQKSILSKTITSSKVIK